jgi:hypothetical protein
VVSPRLSTTGIVVAVVGLTGSVSSAAAQYAGSPAYLGLGVGGSERLASPPGNLWMLMIGVIAMFLTRTWASFRSGAGERCPQDLCPADPPERDASWAPADSKGTSNA